MATPGRLVELRCPRCGAFHWEIDCDCRGADLDGDERGLTYPERTYECPACGVSGEGYEVGRKSPPEFFLQPHPMCPMRPTEFNKWVDVLRAHFPNHPRLAQLGKSWR